jgi:zinc and cadmium transporter
MLNILCGLASLAGAVGAVLLVDIIPGLLPYLLALAASSFLYVALSDLVPDLHNSGPTGPTAVRQVVLVGLGMGTVLLL